jgi:hypothetical protein
MADGRRDVGSRADRRIHGVLYLPSLRTIAVSPAVSGPTWGAVLILSSVLWPSLSRRVAEKDAKRSRHEKEFAAAEVKQNEEKRAANLEKLKSMTADQPLAGLVQPARRREQRPDRSLGSIEKGAASAKRRGRWPQLRHAS